MRINKKLATGITAGVLVVAGSGVALAYWTAAGTGTGSGAVAAGAPNLAIAQTSTISNLSPGTAPQTIAGSVTNGGDASAFVTTVTVSIASVTKAVGAPAGTCDDTDYTLSNPAMNVGQDLAKNASATFSGATIAFNNKSTNQDACKGATVNLAYAAV